jgi:hypothetical protein
LCASCLLIDSLYVQGAGDFASILRDSAINIKGKLAAPALETFFEQLMPSRSRTVSLAVVRVRAKSLTEDARAQYDEVRLWPLLLFLLQVQV